jgi:hypothetical protein
MNVLVDQKASLENIVTSAVGLRIIRSLPHTLVAQHENENGLTISTPVILSVVPWGRLRIHCLVRRSVISDPLRE